MTDPQFSIAGDVRRIVVRRFKAGSMLKLVFAMNAVVFIPLFVFFGVLAFFGAKTVTLSGEHVTGVKGLITALIFAPIFTGIISLFAWVGAYFAIRVLGHFKPLTLEYVPAPEENERRPASEPTG